MYPYMVGSLVFALLIAIFALQKAGPVSIRLFFWTFPQIPLVLVIFGTALVGLVTGILLGHQPRRKAASGALYVNREPLRWRDRK